MIQNQSITPPSSVSKIGRAQLTGQRISLFGLFLFASFAFLVEVIASIGLYLTGLGVLLQTPAYLRPALREPVIWMFLIFVLSTTGVALATIPLQDGSASGQWSHYRDWLRLWMFIPLAWVAAGNETRKFWLLALAGAGFVLGRLVEIDQIYLSQMLTGQRPRLSYETNGLGLYAAITFVGVIVLQPRIRGGANGISISALGRYLIWLLLLLVPLQLVLTSGSRGVWISLLILMPALYFGLRSNIVSERSPPSKPKRLGSWLAIALALLLIGANYKNIETRTEFEASSYSEFMNMGYGSSTTGSAAKRVHLLQFGLQRWREKPVLGWGVGATEPLKKSHPLLAVLAHLHNGYVEVLLQFGLLNLIVLAAVFALLILGLFTKGWQDDASLRLRIMLACGLAMLALGWLYDYMVQLREWRYCWTLLAGLAFSYRISGPQTGMSHCPAEPD